MDVISRVNPEEATQAAEATPSTVPRKRRYGSTRHAFDETSVAAQGNVTFLQTLSVTFSYHSPGPESRSLADIVADAHAAVAPGPAGRLEDDALLRMERNVRINMDVGGHNLVFELRLFETLKAEHTLLLKEIEERQLTLLMHPILHK